jgi:predicted DNA binding CopG/RHH family protein
MGVRCLRDCIMKKDKSIKIRVSQDEHTAIHAIAKSNGLTLSEFIRSLTQQPMESDLIKKG